MPFRSTSALKGPLAGWGCLLFGSALLLAPTVASAQARPWQLRAHTTPKSVLAGTSTTVEITLRNLDDQPISPAEGDRLAYHWLDADGETAHFDGARTRFADAVGPGETVVVEATLLAPSRPGSYLLQWEPLRERVGWFGAPRRTREILIPVEVVGGVERWRLVAAEVPESLRANEEVEVLVRLGNEGPDVWEPALGDRLSYHWRSASDGALVVRDGLRTELPGPVAVGEEVELRARLRAPDQAGHYTLEWEPLREGVRWRGEPSTPQVVEVRGAATAWAPVDVDVPVDLHAGERTTVDVVLSNLGEEPLGPQRGDRLSYHWLSADEGREAVVWDGLRTELPFAIDPGGRGSIRAEVLAPESPGRYRLVWSLVREGAAWFPASGDQAAAEALVEVLPRRFAFVVDAVSWPLWVPAVGLVEIEVTLRNTGAAIWSGRGADRLSYHWLAADGTTVVEREGRRTQLPRAVAPGEAVKVTLVVSGPGRGGDFVLALDMVREHVAWFGEPEADGAAYGTSGGVPARAELLVVWRSGSRQLGLIFVIVLLLAVARRRRPADASPHWSWVGLVPAIWCFAATWMLIVTFAELSGISLWLGAEALAPASAALPALLLVLAPTRWRGILGFLWLGFLALLGLADLVYLHFLGSIVPVHALTAAHQVGDITGSVRAVLDPSYGWLIPLPVTSLLLAWLWPRPRAPRGQRAPRRWRWGARVVATMLAAATAWPFVSELSDVMASDLGKRVFSEERNIGRLGLVGVHIFDVARALRERSGRGEADPAEVAEIEAFYAERAGVRARAVEHEGGLPEADRAYGLSRGDNLLVVQIESLQGWVVGARVGGQEVTPFLNSVEARGLYFPAIADVTAQGMTSDAEYATLNSAYPLAQGAISFLRANNDFVTIAHTLAAAGYTTFSAHPYKRGFWNRATLHPRYGFVRSLFARELGPGRRIAWGLADEPFFRRVLPEIAALREPFFTFLVTLSVHHPYSYFPADRRRLELGKLEGTALGNYLHGMREMDEAVAELFDELKALGLADHTLVALYGDHDARLGTPPEILELAGVSRWTPAVPRLLERIPLFIVAPESAGSSAMTGTSARVGSLVDLGPTLLHLLGVATPTAFVGAPLLPAGDLSELAGDLGRFAAYPDGSALSAEHLYVAGGREIPAKGACFTASGEPLGIEACAGLREAALRHLSASRAVVDFDLARTLSGP